MREIDRNSIMLACCLLLLAVAMPFPAIAEAARGEIDRFTSENGEITVGQVQQMSVVIETPGGVIYTDPTGGAARYAGHPSADVILVSHEHHEHFDADTLAELAGPDTRIVVPPYVMERLPDDMKRNAVSLANGESSHVGDIHVEAIAAYGMSGQAALWHPPGRGNGYVVSVDGRRLYVAGSTDATPEMLRLRDISIAFLPLYPPYALGPDDAIGAVSAMKPEVVYIYQYSGVRIREEFVGKARDGTPSTTVIARDIGS
jgi:L-ascorbate metabolism protein UlaG (beta-lactamase superfamily)